jgi:GntR family transcriptional repressor for pyruvate dehydrogenase complex
VLEVLIGDIVSGARKPGEALPRESDIAEEFEVSRGTSRESIRGLEERGLISVKHGRGATVNPPSSWDRFDPLVLSAMLAGPDGSEVLTDLLECRRLLEVEAAGIAADRATGQDLQVLSDALQRMREQAERTAKNPAAEPYFHEADTAFHRALIAATHNSALLNLAERLHAGMLTARYALARPGERTSRSLPEHEQILAAVARGEAEEARAAMRTHLATVEEYLQDYRRDHAAAPAPAGQDGTG